MPTLEARGIELTWREAGAGAPVLLIHETAMSSSGLEPLASALAAAGARAITYDRRGWGGSTAPEGYLRTTIEEQSEDAAVLIEAAGAAPAVLSGAGMGAVIALDLLLRRPELVAGGVLVEPPLLGLLPEATELLSSDLAAIEGEAGQGAGALVDLYLSGGLGALASGADRLPADMTAPARLHPPSLVAEIGAVTAWSRPFASLPGAERPSLIVTCASTPPLLDAAAAALDARLAGSRRISLGGGALPPHLGAAAELAREIVVLRSSR